jgi:two-component system, NtrC family, response regulator AtoC
LGSNKRFSADVRVVAATNRDLEAMLVRSEFREDLYYRLNVVEIVVPPLRQRRDEIPHLIDFFIGKYAKRYNRHETALSPTLRETLENYSWPGNIRELENVIKRFVILQDETLLPRDLQAGERRAQAVRQAADSASASGQATPGPAKQETPAVHESPVEPVQEAPANGNHDNGSLNGAKTLSEVARVATQQAERNLIIPTLRRVHWNRRKAASMLGISYKTLLNKIKEHGIVQE